MSLYYNDSCKSYHYTTQYGQKTEQKFQHGLKKDLKFSQDLLNKVHPSSASTTENNCPKNSCFSLMDGKWGNFCYRKTTSNPLETSSWLFFGYISVSCVDLIQEEGVMMTYQYENKFCLFLRDSGPYTNSNFARMLLQMFSSDINWAHWCIFLMTFLNALHKTQIQFH